MRSTVCRKMRSGIVLAGVLLSATGCAATGHSEYCTLYRRVPLAEADVGRMSLPALRAIEANETRADVLCPRV